MSKVSEFDETIPIDLQDLQFVAAGLRRVKATKRGTAKVFSLTQAEYTRQF